MFHWFRCIGLLHKNFHILDLEKFQLFSCEDENISRLKFGNKPFFDGSEIASADILHAHDGISDNRTDLHSVMQRHSSIRYPKTPIVADFDFLVFIVSLQTLTPMDDEVQ